MQAPHSVGLQAGLAFVPDISLGDRDVVILTVSGVVPDDEARSRVLRVVERAARDLGLGARIEDALLVEGPGQRAAG